MKPPQRPGRALRFALRLPVWLYRLRLGWLLGDRFLLLTHIGRKSGLPHQAVIEVIRRDEATGMCLVASGWGSQSDWYRNIRMTPGVRITLGSRQFSARAEFLPVEDSAQELLDYARRHPVAFREITALVTGRAISASEQNCHELAKVIPVVAFLPASKG